jgi:hypothetical protein
MELALLLILGAFLGALSQRVVGGVGNDWIGRKTGSFIPRTILAALHGAFAFYLGLPILYAMLYAKGIWIGCVVGMWSGMDMGRKPRSFEIESVKNWFVDAGYMLVYGVGKVILPTLVVFWLGLNYWWIILLAGALCPLVYEYAWRQPWDIKWLGCQGVNNPRGFDPPPTAELIFGGLMIVGTILTIYMG